MKLHADGFVMTMAYPNRVDRPTGKVNLCPLFWNFMIMTFVARPFLLFIVFVFLVVGFLFGWSYPVVDLKNMDFETERYKNWPRIGEFILSPMLILFIASGIYLAIFSFSYMSIGHLIVLGVIGLVMALIAFLVGKKGAVVETTSLVANFVVAKYKKICPIIELEK